jgi:hypothetical protein
MLTYADVVFSQYYQYFGLRVHCLAKYAREMRERERERERERKRER